MHKLSRTKLLSIAMKLLVLLLIAKVFSLALWWYLPSDGIELNAKKSYQVKYQRVNFKNMLVRVKSPVDEMSTEQRLQQAPAYSINSLLLKGLYGSSFHGFAIVAQKTSASKTTIVEVGEIYAGYTLKEIALDNVIFSKSGKDYILKLKESSKTDYSRAVSKVHSKNINKYGEYRVSKTDIHYYSKNPNKIWKDIAIAPVKKNGKITGFKVNRIKVNSKMAMLGLKKGDIIIEANNIKLSSFKDAINLYKNINKIDTIALIVLRNNQEKEIIYEIH